MRAILLITATLCAIDCSLTLAQAPAPQAPKSPKVQEAINVFDESLAAVRKDFASSVKKLTEAHNAEVKRLRDKHLQKLEQLMKQTTQAAELDEAIAIRDATKALQETSFEIPDADKPAAMVAARVVELENQLTELQQLEAERSSRNAKRSVVGTWRWFDGTDYVFKANGQAEGKLIGNWKQSENAKNAFSITWSNGATDVVKLSDDGKVLDGRSVTDAMRVWAVRLK
jgi:hypothetical protein